MIRENRLSERLPLNRNIALTYGTLLEINYETGNENDHEKHVNDFLIRGTI